MTSRDLTFRLLYRAIDPAAELAARALPPQRNPGKRAYRVVAELGLAPGRHAFARGVIASFMQALVLQRYLAAVDEAALQKFIHEQVVFEGPMAPPRLFEEPRPLIFATPHYGATLAALPVSLELLRGRRVLSIFHDKLLNGAFLRQHFLRAGLEQANQLSGLSGVRNALRALERGECVAILPDAFEDIAQTVVVPFFDRLLRVACGTAFLALRSGAFIVPVFAMPRRSFGLRVLLGEPIDPRRIDRADEAQALFVLSRLLFARIEEQLRFAPEHWRNWEVLPQVSTALGARFGASESQLLLALEARLRALPPPLQNIPELEWLLS